MPPNFLPFARHQEIVIALSMGLEKQAQTQDGSMELNQADSDQERQPRLFQMHKKLDLAHALQDKIQRTRNERSVAGTRARRSVTRTRN